MLAIGSRNAAQQNRTVGRRFDLPRLLVLVAAIYAIGGGAVTLAGWAFDVPRLTDWANSGISMFVNTAICAIACGIALALLATNLPKRRIGVRVFAIAVIVIAGLTFSEHLFGWNLGIDTLLVKQQWGQTAAVAPMRMGPPASISFAILGVALYLATTNTRGRQIASSLAVVPVAIASLSLAGYWFRADELFGIARYTGIAFQTSTMVAALGVGVIAALPRYGIVAAMTRQDAGGEVLRRLILPVIIVPLVLGWLRILGQNAGLYDIAFGTALRTLIEIALFVALLWWTAASISKHSIAAQQAQARLAAIVESSDDVIVSKSLEGIIRSWNAGAERVFGWSRRRGRRTSTFRSSFRRIDLTRKRKFSGAFAAVCESIISKPCGCARMACELMFRSLCPPCAMPPETSSAPRKLPATLPNRSVPPISD